VLFTSYAFIVLFFPVVAILFRGFARWGFRAAGTWLLLSSLFFYGYAFPAFLPVLLLSIVFNYLMGWSIVRFRGKGSGLLLAAGVTINLAALGYFKYARFLADTFRPAWTLRWHLDAVALPLGISFFTFTQIAFLVDARRGLVRDLHPVRYALFVSYFPHLIAGPILHHREMTDQFKDPGRYRPRAENLAAGATVFIAGLFKKICLADPLAVYVTPAFQAGQPPGFWGAWVGALSYSFQLYFDFSGYCDMATGLSLLLGFRLPMNFNSPYRALNIADFWRRWHMTLSRFLRDYLYIPLGGGRRGSGRKILNVAVTMLLGGLWHGANWTFVLWGGLHGAYLMVHQLWSQFAVRRGWDRTKPSEIGRALSVAVTFLAVLVGWVVFRAPNIDTAWVVLRGMAGRNGVETVGGLGGVLWIRLALSGVLVWFAPNISQWMRAMNPYLDPTVPPARWQADLAWRPSWGWWLWAALLFWVAWVSAASVPSTFLYYQF